MKRRRLFLLVCGMVVVTVLLKGGALKYALNSQNTNEDEEYDEERNEGDEEDDEETNEGNEEDEETNGGDDEDDS
ncbi:hypothetical protein E2C01_100680 [Portunus trituberculatus]|uniref:Uncharacterized protein n=1 Tax=Portunus trituberculatus TaxID=210409 RepID=A0A5B7KK15_PORTR|nr:hypothetical protein [Portunus trituberculatus]